MCQDKLVNELIKILKYGNRLDYLKFWRKVTAEYGHPILKEVQRKANDVIGVGVHNE